MGKNKPPKEFGPKPKSLRGRGLQICAIYEKTWDYPTSITHGTKDLFSTIASAEDDLRGILCKIFQDINEDKDRKLRQEHMWNWKNRNEKYNWSVHICAHTHIHELNGGLKSSELRFSKWIDTC